VKYERRLRTLASRAGLCPVHLTPLVCICGWRWVGTADEFHELGALMDRLTPYYGDLPAQGWCRHGHEQHCWTCWQADASYAIAGVSADDLFSAEEWQRYQALLKLFQRKPTDGRG
jgi:hypothetical protein